MLGPVPPELGGNGTWLAETVEPGRTELMGQEGPQQRASASTLELTALMTSLVLSPVVIFLRFHAYRSIVVELALIAAVALAAFMATIATRRYPLVRAALLAVLTTWLVDLGFDVNVPVHGIGATKLLAAIFLASFGLFWLRAAVTVHIGTAIAATMLVSSLLTPPGPVIFEAGQARPGTATPLFVHVLLDEHMGIAGLQSQPVDPAIAGEVRGSLERAGFRVYGGAYSQEMWSFKSLARLFNPTVGLNGVRKTTAGVFQQELTANEYFDRLVREGYALHVMQFAYMNLCPSSLPALCRTYDYRRFRTAEFKRLSVVQRLDIMGFLLAGQSDVWRFVRRFVDVGWGPAPDRIVDVVPMSAMDTLNDLGASLSRASAGDAYFAHVSLPHFPYAYDRDCRVRPIGEWLDRVDYTLSPRSNTADGRLARYEQYVGQMRCVVKRFEKVLAAIPDALARDAIIIVQGDHGSRITEYDPGEALSRHSDFVESYSTLFAVRAPGISAGYQPDQVSLTCLFQGLLNVGFRKSPDLSSCGASEPVFSAGHPSVGVMPRMDAVQ